LLEPVERSQTPPPTRPVRPLDRLEDRELWFQSLCDPSTGSRIVRCSCAADFATSRQARGSCVGVN
ncbi:MAG: hypothetical protein RR960_06330, partial [Alistipes sp.]